MEVVHNTVILAEMAKMEACCELINPKVQPALQELQDKHYLRKRGKMLTMVSDNWKV